MGYHPRDAQALFSLIRHHFSSFSALERSFSAAYCALPEFSVQLVVCYVSLNCSLNSVCLERNENGRLAAFDDIT